jgi:hypothetical protein
MHLGVSYVSCLYAAFRYIDRFSANSRNNPRGEAYKQESDFAQLRKSVTRLPQLRKRCSLACSLPLLSPSLFFENFAVFYRRFVSFSANKEGALIRHVSDDESSNDLTMTQPIPFKTPRIRRSGALRFLESVSQLINNPVATEIGETP